MAEFERKGKLGERIEGVIVQPSEVSVVGVIDESAGYFVGITVVTPTGERATILLPLEFEPAFTRTFKEKADELRDGITAPRS